MFVIGFIRFISIGVQEKPFFNFDVGKSIGIPIHCIMDLSFMTHNTHKKMFNSSLCRHSYVKKPDCFETSLESCPVCMIYMDTGKHMYLDEWINDIINGCSMRFYMNDTVFFTFFQSLANMQTVVTWRRPTDVRIYPPTGNPCRYLIANSLCYIISGLLLLVVGVIVTSLAFQNLEHYQDEKQERYAGPVLIAAGALIMAKGVYNQWRPRQIRLARQRSFLRRYMNEIYSRPILVVGITFNIYLFLFFKDFDFLYHRVLIMKVSMCRSERQSTPY